MSQITDTGHVRPILGQSEIPGCGCHGGSSFAPQSRERRSEAGGSVGLGRHRPQGPGYRVSLDQPALQGEEREGALGSLGKDEGRFLVRLELEPTEERDPRS